MLKACRPPLFLITGFFWLVLASLAGLALFLGPVLGKPLPPWLRLLHAHAALVGGVAQMILGALLAFIPPLLLTGRDRVPSHPVLYLVINAGAVGLLVGFALGQNTVVAAAGALVPLAFLSVAGDAMRQARASLNSPPLNLWFYGVALLLLFGGLGAGEGMAGRLFPAETYGRARLAHIHLNLLGFVTLTIIGTMHNLFPTVLQAPLHSPRLARLTFFILPAGILVLVGGFLLGDVAIEIAGGAAIFVGALLYTYNILRTWLDAGRPTGAASDHLLIATFFLVVGIGTGLLVGVNYLWNPPAVPFGALHLMAYTHLTLVGFIFQTVVGALTHLLPIMLAVARVASTKKRGAYLAELTGIMEQWRPVQVWTLSFGTLGLAVVAALVWHFPLLSTEILVASLASGGLLLAGIGLATGKVLLAMLHRPPV
ncbi:hypothetical protein [Nitrospira sp. Kam-Ns4a]